MEHLKLGYRPTGLQLYLLFIMGLKRDLTIKGRMSVLRYMDCQEMRGEWRKLETIKHEEVKAI